MKNIETNLSGILNVYKPVGITSFSVISRLRKILGIKKIGHCGTLDPFACGVLPVCVGKSTRVIQYMDDSHKSYKCTLIFGVSTDTQDCEGKPIGGKHLTGEELTTFAQTDYEMLRALILSFKGAIKQIPPMYSAVKVKGKPLYRYAREGTVLERKARDVTIDDIQINRFFVSDSTAFLYPNALHAEITVHCSKGTYIRTLCHDIGDRSGFGACAVELERLSSGVFRLENAYTLDDIEKKYEKGEIKKIILTEADMLMHIPLMSVTDQEAKRLVVGQRLPFSDIEERLLMLFPDAKYEGERIRVNADDKLIALLKIQRKGYVSSMEIERVFV